ncbi:circularly permutated Ras protein 1-like [Saccoglossus kowalevskii]
MPSASPPDAPYDRLRSPPPRKAVSLSYDNIRPGTPHLRANTESKYDNLSPLPTDPPPPKPPRRKKKKKKGKESTIEEDAELAGYAEPYDVPRKPNLYASIGEGGAALKPPPLPNRPESHLHDKKGGKKYQCRRADTNVISVKFDTLVKPSHMHTGDSVTCEGCGAVLSHLSILTDSGDGGKIWKCEFCEHINRVDIMDGEIPKKDDVTYMLQPSPGTTDPAGYFGDDSIIIFVMDVSGSMCVTTPVPGKFPLRANDSTRALELYNTSPDTDQYMPSERRGTTYVSRLQAMQSAVDHNLSKLCKDCSTKRIGLVSFNNEVTVIGDGSDTPITLAGDKLYDKENLISFGSQLPLPMFIKETRNVLADKIFNLEEGGQTALGPSLLVSVAMASQKAGSKVIICTDGKANIGLGSLEAEEDDMAYDTAAMFYEDLGTYARDKG